MKWTAQENRMSLKHQQLSDTIDIIQFLLKNFVKVLNRFDALENSNTFRFLLLSLLGMFSFFLYLACFFYAVHTLISY